MPTIEHDDQGGTIVHYGSRKTRRYNELVERRGSGCRDRHGICKKLPNLRSGVDLADVSEETAKYRMCVCYAPPCCQEVYEPVLFKHNVESSVYKAHDWRWVRVSRWRLIWFRLRGWL